MSSATSLTELADDIMAVLESVGLERAHWLFAETEVPPQRKHRTYMMFPSQILQAGSLGGTKLDATVDFNISIFYHVGFELQHDTMSADVLSDTQAIAFALWAMEDFAGPLSAQASPDEDEAFITMAYTARFNACVSAA